MTACPTIWFINRFFFPDHSATSQILSDLAFHLASQGRRVGIITSRGVYDDPAVELPAFETVRGVEIRRVGRSRFGRNNLAGRAVDYAGLYVAFAAAVGRYARKGDWIVAKTDPPLLSAAIAPVAQAKGLRLVNWLQDVYPEVALGLGLHALRPIAPLLKAARNYSLRIAECNVAIGERMREHLLREGAPPERTVVIPNWCDDEAIKPLSKEENPLRRQWGLMDKFVVGYSGNLGRAHEYDTLVGAAEILRDEPNIVFLFIGGGALMPGLKAEVERRALSHMFRFFPYQDASLLPQSLCVPDLHWISLRPEMEGLIVPSKFYGIAAAGRATVAVTEPLGEVGGLIENFGCGETVQPEDSAVLATAIQRCTQKEALCEAMGRNARAMLDRTFSSSLCKKSWNDILTSPEIALHQLINCNAPVSRRDVTVKENASNPNGISLP
ncbi:glycosyltransferase family 4 protein [Rhodoblastus acidophilus]|nr:glycosyltransferase family 4 protein [Rhodoblastus acidophilus]